MTAPHAAHPSAAELAAFAAGRLAGPSSQKVAAHLKECPACRRIVASPASAASEARTVYTTDGGSSDAPVSGGTLVAGAVVPSPAAAAPAPAPAAHPGALPPELANHPRYRIGKELGRGGMGVVYQAEQTLMDRRVAIKVISKALLDQPGALERFQREVRAAAKLSHPNIVIAYDAEQAGDLHMLVMEFVEGQSLDQVLRRKGPLPLAHACHYVRQAALGLQHALERGMVHRDIKPQNLMLTPKGQVKILDFGLAKVASEQNRSGGDFTVQGTYMGTPDYSAPEQATDARSADIRADIYSLGCTLYCLLAGKPPFQGGTDIQTILAHLEKPPPPLPELRSDVPPELWAVVAKMLAKAPGQRYQKPAEVAQALAPFCKPGSKAPVPDVAPPGVSSPGRATPTPHDTKPLAGVAKAGTPAADETDLLPSPRRPKPAAAAPARRNLPLLLAGGAAAALVAVVVLALGVWVLAGFVLGPKTKQGVVMLKADPGDAEVFVDDHPWTPAHPADNGGLRIELPEGEHDLKVVKSGFDEFTRHITVRAGQTDSITAKLVPTGYVQLFNGKDLTGWKVHPSGTGQWKVQDGLLTCSGPPSHLFSERSDYQNFHFRVEAMINDGGDSGQYFRTLFGPGFPRGYETQIDVTPQVPIKTGSLYLPDVPEVLVSKALHKPDEWFTQEVIADGNHIIVKVNGQETVNWPDPEHRYTRGNFALQHHDAKTVVKFRKVEIKELPATLVPPPPTPPPGFVALFNGKDKTGWRTHRDQPGRWDVKDGVLIGSGPQDSYLYTVEDDFTDFDLHVEAKINDGGNSGIFFRAGFGPTLPRQRPRRPAGYEAQINSTHDEAERIGSLFAHPGGAVSSVLDKLVPPGEWFTLDAIAEGNHIVIKVNGKTTADWIDPTSRHARGTIAVEHLDPKTLVEFRKIEVKKLAPAPPKAGAGNPG
jgi:tRNA A-37 threonylcarbamoyl transferase component Bud32